MLLQLLTLLLVEVQKAVHLVLSSSSSYRDKTFAVYISKVKQGALLASP
jgi:hypothetical protein